MVTIWTTCFGNYARFLPDWCEAALAAGPDDILVIADRELPVPTGVRLEVHDVPRKFPEAQLRNIAVSRCETEWVWPIDVDDSIYPDALGALSGKDCEVIQVGFVASNGWHYIPEVIPNEDYLKLDHNPYVSGSPFRKRIFETVNYPSIAFSDWGLWRKAARAGFAFEADPEPRYRYRWEPGNSLSGKYIASRHKRAALRL